MAIFGILVLGLSQITLKKCYNEPHEKEQIKQVYSIAID